MQNIPIQALPNQTLSVPLDNNQWDISIKTTNGTVSVTLVLNGIVIIENLRAVAGTRIIPDKYQESGNFAIITQNFQIPDYTQFGNTQTLVYISAAELSALRVPLGEPITPEEFDPNGALPLRYKPVGYELG